MGKRVLSEEDRKKVEEYYKKGNEAFNNKNYEEAIKLYNKTIDIDENNSSAWYSIATSLGRIGKYKKAIENINRAIDIDPYYSFAWNNKGFYLKALRKFNEAIIAYEKAIEINNNNDIAWSNKGDLFETLNRNKEAIHAYNKALEINNDNSITWNNKGHILEKLNQFNEAIDCYNRAVELKNIISISNRKKLLNKWLRKLYTEKNYSEVENIVIKYSYNPLDLLTELNTTDKSETETLEGIAKIAFGKDPFFSQTVKKDDKDIDTYKDIYLQSLKIISLLHIKNNDYFPVAHYTQKSTAEFLLQKNKKGEVSPFRLSTIVTANDPREGKPLLQYLGIDERHASDYSQAFVGCFIFNPDCLNQFRLYGKENGEEATGVSLVMKPDFFNTDLSINKGLINPSNEKLNEKGEIEEVTEDKKEQPMERESLFRCIYIDPVTGQAISIGHKDSYTFYRDKLRESKKNELGKAEVKKIEKEIEDYEGKIKDILNNVKENLNDLKKLTSKKGLNPTIICELLTHLRYLVKHVAFKEEQECRVIKVEKLKGNKNIKVAEDKSRMYIDYRTIDQYVTDIYFAPKAKGMALFQDLLRREGLDIKCHQSDHPFF